jgi:hypothetical protein
MRHFGPGIHLHQAKPKDEIQPLPTAKERIVWHPSPHWALVIGILAGSGVLAMTSISEFLYFQF